MAIFNSAPGGLLYTTEGGPDFDAVLQTIFSEDALGGGTMEILFQTHFGISEACASAYVLPLSPYRANHGEHRRPIFTAIVRQSDRPTKAHEYVRRTPTL